jgi:hypothetical protein
MVRILVVAVVVAGCASKQEAEPAPKQEAEPALRTVELPTAVTSRTVVTGPIVVDDGTALHLVPAGTRLASSGIAIPTDAPASSIAELGTTLDRLRFPRATVDGNGVRTGVPVVMPPSTPAARVGEIADALWASGRCLVPVLRAASGAATFVTACPVAPAEGEVMTVLMMTTETWVGLSRIQEYQLVPVMATGDHDFAKLESILKDHKISALFADRRDLELTGDGVAYDQLIIVGELADKVGFSEVRLVSHQRATARPEL